MESTIIGLIVSVVLFIVGVVIAKKGVSAGKIIRVLAIIPLIIGLGLAMIQFVPTGYTGILTTFGRVEDKTMTAGAHVVAPWQKVVKLDTRTQKVSIETVAFSSDIQQVDIQITVNYSVDQQTARNLYKTVGQDYFSKVVYPRILENTKATFSSYTAESLVAQRSALSNVIEQTLSEDMREHGVTIISVSIEDIDFSDAFTDAVEAKQVAEQNKLRAQTEQSQMTMEAQQAAEREIIAATAEAEVNRIQADAALYAKQKEAAANTELAASLSEYLIQYIQALNWNGELPLYIGGDGTTVPILDLTE